MEHLYDLLPSISQIDIEEVNIVLDFITQITQEL